MCKVFFVKHQITQVTQPNYSPDLVPCEFSLFPKLKSPLKGKIFQTISEIQENTMGQLIVIGRTVWGPKVPTLKGTEVSLSCVQCFLYLVFFILHGRIPSGQILCIHIYMCVCVCLYIDVCRDTYTLYLFCFSGEAWLIQSLQIVKFRHVKSPNTKGLQFYLFNLESFGF